MQKLLSRIESANGRYKLFKHRDKILIALSGGPDSVALFHLLNLLAPGYNLSLSAAHVDHGLRCESADDRKFCRALCGAHGIRFHSRRINIKAIAKRKKIGVEQAGRQYRYDYFQALSEKFGYTKIATGHTADDSAETFLLHLVRGAHLGGLSGIPPRRDNIIRPLIEIYKSDLLGFLNDFNLSYRLDRTNLGDDYNRNIIRNKVVPYLQRINSQALRNISRSCQNLRTNLMVIEDKVEDLYKRCLIDESKSQITLDLRKIPEYYKSLESWILLRAYFRLTGESRCPDSNKIIQAVNLKRRGSVALLDVGIIASRHSGRLILCQPQTRIKRIKLMKGETVRLGKTDLMIKTEFVKNVNLNVIKNNDDESIAYIDDANLDNLAVRSIKEGDKFRPLGMKGTKKVADYLSEKGTPRVMKSSIPIVTSGDDIVWLAGYGIDDKYKVTEKTKCVLKFQLMLNK